MRTMTPRQRVKTALAHEEPDFVPIDLGTGGTSSVVPEAYRRLATHLGVDVPEQLVPHIMRLSKTDESILQALDIDTRPVYMRPTRRGIRPCHEPHHYYDDWGVKWGEFDTGLTIYREMVEHPLADATIDDLNRYPWWPDPLDPERYAGVQADAERLFHTTDYALVGCPGFNGVWERSWYLCGFQRMLEGAAARTRVRPCRAAPGHRPRPSGVGALPRTCRPLHSDYQDGRRSRRSGRSLSWRPGAIVRSSSPIIRSCSSSVTPAHRSAHFPPHLRQRLPPAAGPAGRGRRGSQPGAGQRRRDGYSPVEGRVWRPTLVHGRHRHATRSPARHRRRRPFRSSAADCRPGPTGRLHRRAGAQRAGRRAAGKHRGHVPRRTAGRAVSVDPAMTTQIFESR